MLKLSDTARTNGSKLADELECDTTKRIDNHKDLINLWIHEYKTKLEVIRASTRKFSIRNRRYSDADWELAIKIRDLKPLYAARVCNNIGIYEEEDIKLYWLMGLHKLIRRNRERKLDYHAQGLLSIAYNRTMDVMRQMKVAKKPIVAKCQKCKSLKAKVKDCPDCAAELERKTPPIPVFVNFDEVQDYASVDFLLYDYIKILGAESFGYYNSKPEQV